MQKCWRRNLRLIGDWGSSLASLLSSRLCMPLLQKSIQLFCPLPRQRPLVPCSLYFKFVCFSNLPVANTSFISLAPLPSSAVVAGSSAPCRAPCLPLPEWDGWGGHAVLTGKQTSDFVFAYGLWHFWCFLKCEMFQRKQQLGFYWKINMLALPLCGGLLSEDKATNVRGKGWDGERTAVTEKICIKVKRCN